MKTRQAYRWMLFSGIVFALLSVLIGAFAAHGLKGSVSEYGLALFETAARYQMYHALALILCANLSLTDRLSQYWLNLSAKLFVFGILVFSGSLYFLAFSGIKWLGAITPVGGTGFIAGWIFLLIAALKSAPLKMDSLNEE